MPHVMVGSGPVNHVADGATCFGGVRLIDGQVYAVTEEIQVRATAYTAGPESTGKFPGHPAYGITASGTTVREGRTIAVDPAVIPLGSELFIPGWGLFVAEDTGKAIVGNSVDIYMDELDDALLFGVRMLEAEVVKPLELYGEVWFVVGRQAKAN